ncbi:MAG: type II toxin-antitoxin system HicB family antitoxin [Terriglobia bacterium]
MLEMRYPATIRQDPKEKDFVVKFPDLEGAITGAATLDEALNEAVDCLASWLAFALAERRPIPVPSLPTARQYSVSVPLWIAPKIALYEALTQQNVSNSELARRLGVRETVVRRMLDPDHTTAPKKIEAALKAVGWNLYVVCAA